MDIQLRVAETEHKLLMKLEETEKVGGKGTRCSSREFGAHCCALQDLAQERTASSALTNRIHELEAREAELVRQLEEQKVSTGIGLP